MRSGDGRDATGRVILVHGIWMVGASMQWFASRLRAEGFAPEVFGYHSVVGGPDEAVPRLADRIRAAGAVDIVAHSLGGLVALRALAAQPDLPVRRVVCLGSPLCGSTAASGLVRWPAAGVWLGRSADLLQSGCTSWPASVEVGMLAGNLSHGLGALVAQFEGENDGSVAVAETRAPGLAGHVVLPVSHSGLLFSRQAVRLAAGFLREGRFGNAQPAADA